MSTPNIGMKTNYVNGDKSPKELWELSGKINEDINRLTGGGVIRSQDDFKQLIYTGKIQLSASKLAPSVKQLVSQASGISDNANVRYQFASGGNFNVNSFNILIDSVRREYGSTEVATFSLDEYAPEMMVNAETIINATYGPNTGMMDARAPGTPLVAKAKLPLTQTLFNPMYFGNLETFNEQELLYLRDFGSQDISSRGIQQALIYNELKLLVMLYQRKFDIIAKGFTTGQYQFTTANINYQTVYGINGAGQQFGLIGPKWALPTGPGGSYVMNPLAYPLNDIWYAISQYAPWKRYLQAIMSSGKFIMNPTTSQWLLTNPNTQSAAAFQVASGVNYARYSLQDYMGNYFPSSNIEIVIDSTMILNDDLTSNFVYPDGYISVMFDSKSHGGAIGDFVYTTNLQGQGGWMYPKPGIFSFVADMTSPQSYGGAQGNPHINIGVGANMGLRIPNPNLVLSMLTI